MKEPLSVSTGREVNGPFAHVSLYRRSPVAMPEPENAFDELAGVPVHYDRAPNAGYGTRGIAYTFHSTEPFEDTLHAAVEELWAVCPLGPAEVLTSAGAYVDKGGMHGAGRAFDIDGIFWADKAFVANRYPSDRAFYLAVEAVLRKHFGTVLNYKFDAAHQDHFHVSGRGEPGFVAAHESRVTYWQMALTHLFDRPVTVDGLTGPETNRASRALLRERGVAEADEMATEAGLHRVLDRAWSDLLDAAREQGFRDMADATKKTPLHLLEALYATVSDELAGQASRKTIESAVTTFAQHPKTDAWLDQFRTDS